MPYIALFSLSITILLMLLSLFFRIAGKLRLTLPLIYFLLVATVLNRWAASHETVAFAIFYGLLAFSIISWIFSLKNFIQDKRYYKAMQEDMSWQIAKAREKGIPLNSVYFDNDGNMRYNDTNELID